MRRPIYTLNGEYDALSVKVLEGLTDKLVKVRTIRDTVYLGWLHGIADGVMLLLDSRKHLRMSTPLYEVATVQQMPEVAHDSVKDLLEGVRARLEDAYGGWDGEVNVGESLHDVEDLADLVEVLRYEV